MTFNKGWGGGGWGGGLKWLIKKGRFRRKVKRSRMERSNLPTNSGSNKEIVSNLLLCDNIVLYIETCESLGWMISFFLKHSMSNFCASNSSKINRTMKYHKVSSLKHSSLSNQFMVYNYFIHNR